MTADPFDLARFVKAQEHSYATALDEVTNGRKQSHWVWFILPQLRGLGHSEMAHKFGISGMAEAQAYMAHPLLGPRLVEVVQTILQHKASSAGDVLGDTDACKFQSCLTLFSLAAPQVACFNEALQQFFSSERDAATLKLVAQQPRDM